MYILCLLSLSFRSILFTILLGLLSLPLFQEVTSMLRPKIIGKLGCLTKMFF